MHKFYLGKVWQGILYVCLAFLGPIPFGASIALAMEGGYSHGDVILVLVWLVCGPISIPYLLWWVGDGFTLRRQVDKVNATKEQGESPDSGRDAP